MSRCLSTVTDEMKVLYHTDNVIVGGDLNMTPDKWKASLSRFDFCRALSSEYIGEVKNPEVCGTPGLNK